MCKPLFYFTFILVLLQLCRPLNRKWSCNRWTSCWRRLTKVRNYFQQCILTVNKTHIASFYKIIFRLFLICFEVCCYSLTSKNYTCYCAKELSTTLSQRKTIATTGHNNQHVWIMLNQWVSRVYCSTQHVKGHFGDRSALVVAIVATKLKAEVV